MNAVDINSFKQLGYSAQISVRTIAKLRTGNIEQLTWQTIAKIAKIVQVSPVELIEKLSERSVVTDRQQIASLQQEYDSLYQQLQQQRETLQVEFQDRSLQTLESFLIYYPTAKKAAIDRPDFPATKLFPLIGAIDRLLAQWNVTAIGTVGMQLPYDPQLHQLIEGSADRDELVQVRYVGYLHQEKLLFRAKVSTQLTIDS